jgi:hypothetical protein
VKRRFGGEIAGLGTGSGVRLVLGMWQRTPVGPFADVMLQEPDGRRLLLAPTPEVAAFLGATYTFDEVRVGQVVLRSDRRRRHLAAPGLEVFVEVGGRTLLGRLLRLVPGPIATAPAWLAVVDPLARLLLRGVRTRGSAKGGRREFYGATDVHRLVAVSGTWQGEPLGPLRPVDPPVTFGFGSTPAAPSLTTLVTTVVESRQ